MRLAGSGALRGGDLFYKQLDKRMSPEPNTGCWLWMGDVDRHGYGRWNEQRAHRRVYEKLVGEIPDGLQLDHLCRVRCCVNPAHLEPVTCRENLLRGQTITSRNAAKTHCKRGHSLTSDNLTIDRRGMRQCVTCAKERHAAWWSDPANKERFSRANRRARAERQP